MKNNYYQISAFSNERFKGNQAGVLILENWLSGELMQKIAKENQLAETAFIVPVENVFEIRWFTPTYEIDLCGHATLASAWVIFNQLNYDEEEIIFQSHKSGEHRAKQLDNGRIQLNFPSRPGKRIEIPADVEKAFGHKPLEAYQSRDMLLIFDNEETIKSLKPKTEFFQSWETLGVICSARGNQSDFVSRVFDANDFGVEDPVTGSAHCTSVPYWSMILGKDKLYAKQLSERTGELFCELTEGRVLIAGDCQLHLSGRLRIE